MRVAVADKHGADVGVAGVVDGGDGDGEVAVEVVPDGGAGSDAQESVAAAGHGVVSPVVRKFAGVNQAEVDGSGEGGRITRSDTKALIEARGDVSIPDKNDRPSANALSDVDGLPVGVEKIPRLRKRIAS